MSEEEKRNQTDEASNDHRANASPPNFTTEEARNFPEARRRWMTLPNALCFGRIIGSVVLLGIAFAGQQEWFVGLFLVLALTDWVDGKLAIWLDQRSIYGTRLDSAADACMYLALLIGGVKLKWPTLSQEWIWIALAVGSYLLSAVYGVWKFRAVPSYHTRLAKTCWLLVMVGAICLLLDWTVWPFRIALAAVLLSNLEALAITYASKRQRFNVKSLYHVLRKS